MIKQVPIPASLLKTAVGLREDSDIVRMSISGDVVNIYLLSDEEDDSVLTAENSEEKLELSYQS